MQNVPHQKCAKTPVQQSGLFWSASNKLAGWVCDFSPWANSAMEATKDTKFGTKVAWGWGWCPNLEYMHSAEKACASDLDNASHVTCLKNTTKTYALWRDGKVTGGEGWVGEMEGMKEEPETKFV